ncbi:putative mitochondrial inner membrane protease atp23 [Coleophoma cylindrospora]|uniref:Mitochondrial inner membrane protease ATP23 n=1 Tax=Coleophoma cylindrospora TaxID=1849047 RepID=A0A3D8QCS9_9HELO|nr:putative mitochondrial inner membrane protease atp23 [Coleophoma cylindrospora]
MSEDTPKLQGTPVNPSNDPKKTGYDPSAKWTNYFNILTGRMTDDGKDAFREDAYIRNEARDCKKCEEWRDYVMEYSPIIRFMNKNIQSLNGDLNKDNIMCRRCPTRINEKGQRVRQGGGFSPDHGIQICANEMRNQGHLEDTLAHEMVHAFDHLRFKVDWADLRHAACTEIRASSLSGECRWTREFFTRNNWTVTQQHQACVRNRAVRSVMSRPSCKDDVQAVKVVNEVWDSCYADTRPFDEIYK